MSGPLLQADKISKNFAALVAVDAVNDGRAHMLARRRIAEECPAPGTSS